METTKKPLLYLSIDDFILKEVNRKNEMFSLPLLEKKPNFRFEIAKTRQYKGNRNELEKPFHFNNLAAYMLANYDCIIANGLEADDMMCIEQTKRNRAGKDLSIICSRDKDLRQCPGWHYSWECGKQGSIGPVCTDEIGWIEKQMRPNSKNEFKVLGYGLAFFYYQMLTGDVVDNIPGLPKYGQVKAYNIIEKVNENYPDVPSEIGLYISVSDQYRNVFKENWEEKFMEQANLLWLIKELDDNGDKVMYEAPK